MSRSTIWTTVTAVGTSIVTTACASSNRLHEFDYAGRTLAVVSDVPVRPEVLTGPLFVGRSGNPIRDAVRAGAQVVRAVEARAVQERLDSAATLVDVGYVLEARALQRAARYLGADATEAEGAEDYVLELVVVEYGIDAEDWDATAYFYVEADAALLHASSGTEIWRAEIDASDPIGPEIYSPGRSVGSVVTAAVLADLTVHEIAAAFESLADYSARAVTDRLRDDLRKARVRQP